MFGGYVARGVHGVCAGLPSRAQVPTPYNMLSHHHTSNREHSPTHSHLYIHTIMITLDLDLYERALKNQQSERSNHLVLRAGELHICFSVLHGLGKYLGGSGLDTVAVETGIYCRDALSRIYTGKMTGIKKSANKIISQ